MESKDEFKKIDIKNCMYHYFDGITTDRDIYSVDILLDEKIYENISVYDISYKTSMGSKPLSIRFNKIDGFITVLDCKIKHLVLFDYGLFDKTCDKIKYLRSKNSGITNSINHNFGKVRTDSYYSWPIEKILTFSNVIMLIKPVVNKNKNNYYYNILLEKGSYKDKSDTQYF